MSLLKHAMLTALGVTLTLTGMCGISRADYPEKPIVMVVGYAAGGSTDLPARAFAHVFSKYLGTNVVIKNVVGASGVAGCTEVAKARPDGYTLLYGPIGPMAMYPNIQKLPYSPDSFVSCFRILQDHSVLWTPKTAPWTDLKSMIAEIKKNPGKYCYATSGVNNPAHMANLLLFKELGLKVRHLPSNGGSGCIQAMNTGNAHFYADVPPVGRTYDLRALGVYSPERLPHCPDIPTFKEQGVNPPETYVWQGIFAPKGTPREIVDKLSAVGEQVVNSPELKELFAKLDTIPAYMNAQDFDALYRNEIKRQHDIYVQAGVLKQ